MLQPDLATASAFLAALTGEADPRVTFQTFTDAAHTKPDPRAHILHGRLSEHAAQLTRLNDDGAGVFVCISATDLQGRKTANVLGLRALFTDHDGPAPDPVLPPSIVVLSAAGEHRYWLLHPGEQLSAFSPAQRQLAAFYGSDPKVHDLARVLRLPGFLHRKSTPFAVLLVAVSDVRYTIAEVLAAHPVAVPPPMPPIPPPQPLPAFSLGDRIKRGEQLCRAHPPAISGQGGHTALFALCIGLVKGLALPGYAALDLVTSLYNPRCEPPWSDKELEHKIRDAETADKRSGYLLEESKLPPPAPVPLRPRSAEMPPQGTATAPAGDPPPHPSPSPDDLSYAHRLTDLGNAERFARMHGADVRYAFLWESWLIWDGKRWAPDQTDEILRRSKLTVRAIYEEARDAFSQAEAKAISAHAAKSEANARIQAMLALGKAEPKIGLLPEQLDADPWVLNLTNGALDLRTQHLAPHDRAALASKLTPVPFDPAATCPLWDAFLDLVMGGNHELIGFLQRAVGYSLTGSTREQCMFVLHGVGQNGKSTFLNTVRTLLADYAQQADPKTFQVKNSDAISNDIARLKGSRLVAAAETESGGRLAESLVKQLTGGEPLTARFLHHEFFSFCPQFKVWLATNHRPIIRGADNAIWRRIRLIPFEVKIAQQDKDFPAKLLTELPGILAWAVRGCASWLSGGLQEPEEVLSATQDYRSEMDILGPFFSECCHLDKRSSVTAAEIYKAYVRFCNDSGDEPMKQRSFGMSLTERGLQRKTNGDGRSAWKGIGLGQPTLRLLDTDDTDDTGQLSDSFKKTIFSYADTENRSVSSVSSVEKRGQCQLEICPDCSGTRFHFSKSGKPICSKCWGAA